MQRPRAATGLECANKEVLTLEEWEVEEIGQRKVEGLACIQGQAMQGGLAKATIWALIR